MTEAKANVEEARDAIVNLRSGYPNIMKQVDQQHCEYYVLRQFTKYYHHLGQTGQIDAKHEGLIQEELDKKISNLKLKKDIKRLDFDDQVLHS